jgi:hypothetical protein
VGPGDDLEEPAGSAASAIVGCTGYACNYQDPRAMGCWPNAQPLEATWITSGSNTLAKVEGWYSSPCGAQWTTTTNLSSSLAAIEASQKLNGTSYGAVAKTNALHGEQVTSLMFGAGYLMQACGKWDATYQGCTVPY